MIQKNFTQMLTWTIILESKYEDAETQNEMQFLIMINTIEYWTEPNNTI